MPATHVRVDFYCEPAQLPRVVQRILLDGMPLVASSPYLDWRRPPPGGIVLTNPALVGAVLLARMALDGRLPGPASFRQRAAAFFALVERSFQQSGEPGGGPPRARKNAARLVAEGLGLLAEAEQHFPA
jgi:hypothetical protein